MTRSPALFVSHGSPMFALEPGVLGPNLQAFGGALGALRAIVVVSPHWQTRGVRVTGAAAPDTIHDFGGFPQPLYALRYEPPGDPALAQELVERLRKARHVAIGGGHRFDAHLGPGCVGELARAMGANGAGRFAVAVLCG